MEGDGDIAPIRPLTSVHGLNHFRALKDTIDAMRPRANTIAAIGVAWGLATLSTGEPFTEAAAFGTGNLKKFMLVLTDGEYTHHIDGKVNTNVGNIFIRTRLACQAAKDAVTVNHPPRQRERPPAARMRLDEKKYFDVQYASEQAGVKGDRPRNLVGPPTCRRTTGPDWLLGAKRKLRSQEYPSF